jgi:imidazolonepropionase-like amidohydrolase
MTGLGFLSSAFLVALFSGFFLLAGQYQPAPPRTVVLHASRLLDVKNGNLVKPGEVLVQGDRIVEAGPTVTHPAGTEVMDLGDRTLLPGLIDVHVHLFLHPGAEDLQTVQESVPQRTITATLAARDDLMAGFTSERDMGTEGAGSADTAVRDAINEGRIPGPRLRISGNAINILGGHEDAIGYNPAQHVLPNADYANNAAELVAVMRQQFKEGADFIKIYETGPDTVRMGSSRRFTSTQKRNWPRRCRRRRAWAGALPYMPQGNRERFLPRKLASYPSIMPISSPTRLCV